MKLTFEQWHAEVDRELELEVAITSDWLPDYDYQKAYKENRSPKTTAKAVIRNARNY